jgi:hypothetical protein
MSTNKRQMMGDEEIDVLLDYEATRSIGLL